MKLYYATGACSLAPHIVSHEAGIALELERVDTKTKLTATGADFWQINPKGYVPVLVLDDGAILTEGPVISQYLADLMPQAKLVPANGTIERYRVQEMLGYINSELHKTYSPLFAPTVSPETRADREAYLRKRYRFIEQIFADGRDYLFGARFSIADAYLFVVTNWAAHVKLDISEFPKLLEFQQRVAARPAVQEALSVEGLSKKH